MILKISKKSKDSKILTVIMSLNDFTLKAFNDIQLKLLNKLFINPVKIIL